MLRTNAGPKRYKRVHFAHKPFQVKTVSFWNVVRIGLVFFFLYLDRMQYIFNVLPDWVQTDIWSMWLLIFTLSTLPLNLWNFMLNVRNSKHTCDDAYGLFHMKFYLWPSPVAIQYGGIVWALNISKQSIKCVIIFFIPL